jgi:hypothetical protein
MAPGAGPIIATEIRAALAGVADAPRVHAFSGGLGGRNLPLGTLARLLEAAGKKEPTRFAVIDADPEKMERTDA